MFADCCMRKRWEWGFMAAVGQPRPPWLIILRNCIEQKTLSPSPIPPSAPPPPPRIMPLWWAESADAKKRPIRRGGYQYDGPEAGRHGWGVCLKLANWPSKNTNHKQIDRLDRWCANDNIVTSTWDHDKNQYAVGPQDHLLLVNTISTLSVWDSHAEPAGLWSTNSYFKYEFVQGYRISMENVSPPNFNPKYLTQWCDSLFSRNSNPQYIIKYYVPQTTNLRAVCRSAHLSCFLFWVLLSPYRFFWRFHQKSYLNSKPQIWRFLINTLVSVTP